MIETSRMVSTALLMILFLILATEQFSKIANGSSLSGMQCSCILYEVKGEEHFRERPSTSLTPAFYTKVSGG